MSLTKNPGRRKSMKKALLLTALLLSGVTAAAELFPVEIESGTRQTFTGDVVAYSLYIPQAKPELPAPPWPAVVLNHGFSRTKKTQANNANYLAQRGFVVLTPNQVGLGGFVARETNITVTLDHLDWIRRRSTTPGDPLDGLVDPRRLGLAGHSAGGALSFEAAARSQTSDLPVSALFLLDAVPWRSTLEAAPGMAPIALGSLRSEPSPCNAQGAVRDLLDALMFAAEDVRVVGGTHCDPENPTDLPCRWACGGSSGLRRYLYLRLMTLFFQDALNAPSVDTNPIGYAPTLEWLERTGLVVRETAG
jgi:pimeloyl-ACP methyl ester carboxylesterase